DRARPTPTPSTWAKPRPAPSSFPCGAGRSRSVGRSRSRRSTKTDPRHERWACATDMATKGRSAAPASGHILREAEAITGGALALFLALSLFSFSPEAKSNLGGPVGQWIADTVLQAVGIAAYLLPVYLGYLTIALLRREAEDFGALRFVG